VPPWLAIAKPRDIAYMDGSPDWTDRTVHFNRLLRDGWQRLENETDRTKWERRHPADERTLVMVQRFESFETHGGPYVVDYTIREGSHGAECALGRATWADWDQRGRLVLARDGRLLVSTGPESSAIIEDFNDQEPDPAAAPASATIWPTAPR
jgi:hypothetical protein